MEYRLLGQLEVLRAGEPVVLRGRKLRALLAVLLLNANRPISVERLVDALWDDRPPDSARATLQYFVHRLRKTLSDGDTSEGVLLTQSGGYLLRVEPGELDVERFRNELAKARRAHEDGDLQDAARAYERALGMWRGPALADFSEETFAQGEIARLEELRLTAIEEDADVRLALGRHAELVGELEGLVRTHALRERLLGQLILALYRSGRQVEALGTYRAARRRLVTELGIEPSAELQRLERAILAQDPSLELRPPAPPAGTAAQPPGGAGPTPDAPAGAAAPGPPAGAAAAPPSRAPATGAAAAPPGPAAGAAVEAEPAGERARAAADRRPQPATPGRAERKLITVLVAGVVETAEDPEDLRVKHAEALQHIRYEVERHGGVVYAAIGGTVLSAFGTPRTREDDPERAVRAALQIARRGARVAVDTGEAVVTPPAGSAGGFGWPSGLGEGTTLVAGIAGTVVDTASALLPLTKPGTVLVGQATHRATERAIVYPKEPTTGDAWQPTKPRSTIGAVVYDSGEGGSPLIERENDLTLLQSLLSHVRQELGPQLVTVVGAAGIGKTRLVHEFGKLVENETELTTWRQGRSVPSGDPAEGSAFSALVEIVKAHAGIDPSDDPDSIGDKLRRAVRDTLDDPREAAAVERHLRPLVGLDESEPLRDEHRQEAFAAWARLIEAMAADRPLTLVFEDLQWADDAMLDFVEDLVDLVGPVPLLVIGTARPELLERRRNWAGGKRNAVIVSLTPLSEQGSARLMDTLLTSVNIPSLPWRTRKLLLARSGGNPLFLEEYVRMLRDEPRRVTAAPLPIPQTIQQLITSRLDALEPVDKALLEDLAVLGEASWVEPLVAISGLERQEVLDSLGRLERRELLRRTRATTRGEPGYAFRHALIRDVVYKQLLRVDRADRHHRAAEWLERHGHTVSDSVDLLARHYENVLDLTRDHTRVLDSARKAFKAAGERAWALGALAAAAHWYGRTLTLWPVQDPERPKLLLRLGAALAFTRHSGGELLAEAREAFEARGDSDTVKEIDYYLSHIDLFGGDAERARERTELADIEESGTPNHPGGRDWLRALGALMSNDHHEAIRIANGIAERGRALGKPGVEGMGMAITGQARLLLGNYTGADEAEDGARLMQANRHPRAAFAQIGLAEALWWWGDLKRCEQVLAAIPDAAEDSAASLWASVIQGMVDYSAGRWDDALAFANAAIDGELAGKLGFQEATCRSVRARILFGRGELDRALDDATTAVELATRAGSRRNRSVALALKGRILLSGGSFHAALACLDQLLEEQREVPGSIPPSGDFSSLLVDLGRPHDLPENLPPTRWLEAAVAFVAGDFLRAAEVYAEIGATPDEAVTRLRAAIQLAAEGRKAEAREQAQRMVDFALGAGASAGLAVAESVLAGLDQA